MHCPMVSCHGRDAMGWLFANSDRPPPPATSTILPWYEIAREKQIQFHLHFLALPW